MLKVLHARLQYYVNQELPDVKPDLEKEEEPNFQYSLDCRETREFQKNIYLCFTDYAKAFGCVDLNEPWNPLNEMKCQTDLSVS